MLSFLSGPFLKLDSHRIALVPPGGAPYNGLYGEALPKGGTFIRPQVYEGVAVSRVEERLGMSVIEIFQRT